MKSRFLLAALAAAWISQPLDARAQAFLQDSRVSEGLGIKAGEWELHPGVAGEVGYDSNYFQASGRRDVNPGPGAPPPVDWNNATYWNNEPKVDAWRFRVTPSISFTSHGRRAGLEGGGPPPMLKLSGSANFSYNYLIANGSQYSDQVREQSHHAESINLVLDILPGARVGGDLSAGFVRTVEASNDVDIPNAFRRDTVLGGAGVIWRPGGGLFSWRVGYDARVTFFEEDAFHSANTLNHQVTTSNRWRFLPRTQIVANASIGWTTYLNSPQTVGGGEHMGTSVGVNGLITNHWGALAMVGWASTFFESPNGVPSQNFDSITGQAEVTWYPMPQPKLLEGERPVGLSAVSVGYHRNWGISYLGEYYQRDRGYGKMVYFFAQKFVFLLTGGLSHISRPPSYFTNGDQMPHIVDGRPEFGRSGENRVDMTAFLEYRLSGSVGINTTFRYDAELTNIMIPLTETNPAVVDDLSFSRFQVFLGARWFL